MLNLVAPSFHDLIKIGLVLLATVAGLRFTLRRSPVLSALLLLAISATVAFKGEHALTGHLPGWIYAVFIVGILMGIRFPCCRVSNDEPWLTRLPALAVMILHCVFDGHVIRDVSGVFLTLQMVGHKFLDGVDNVLITQGLSKWFRIAAQAVVVLATPLGFVFLPERAISPALHLGTFAFVISFNVGCAIHLFHHAWEERAVSPRSVKA